MNTIKSSEAKASLKKILFGYEYITLMFIVMNIVGAMVIFKLLP